MQSVLLQGLPSKLLLQTAKLDPANDAIRKDRVYSGHTHQQEEEDRDKIQPQ